MQLRDHALRKPLSGIAALTVMTAVTMTMTAAGRAPGLADSPVRRPPAQMSAVGGEQLSRPGPQTGAGAPALPSGLSALSWMVSDGDADDVLAAQNPHWPLPPASTLKTLFADTVLPKIPQGAEHRVVESDFDGMGEGSSEVGVMPGQTYRVSDLWLGVFLRSGNDAVHVLAAMNGGVATTVEQMQAKAVALGAHDTHVISPDGYDMPGQVSSAYDLTLFALNGLKNPVFAKDCGTASAEFPGGPTTKGKPFEIDNTNRLLTGFDGVGQQYPGLVGVKNGYTTNAGNTVIEAARHDGHTVLVTVMNPQNPERNEVYKEARELLDWGFSAVAHGAHPIGTLDAVAPPAQETAAKRATKPSATPAWAASANAAGTADTSASYAEAGAAAVAVAVGGVLLFARRRRARRRASL
ncbi:D-alanyl-D-alanine carboxypeptidase family protein [Streptacidiphilus sp. MAP5-3]|uniref:D-alanyl-D-alanine carboxypeptidase family protein n=1 Tax=unclassified Streptacidiphilus TaxID=2643834 RepID=UPI00351301D5